MSKHSSHGMNTIHHTTHHITHHNTSHRIDHITPHHTTSHIASHHSTPHHTIPQHTTPHYIPRTYIHIPQHTTAHYVPPHPTTPHHKLIITDFFLIRKCILLLDNKSLGTGNILCWPRHNNAGLQYDCFDISFGSYTTRTQSE